MLVSEHNTMTSFSYSRPSHITILRAWSGEGTNWVVGCHPSPELQLRNMGEEQFSQGNQDAITNKKGDQM